MLVTAPSTNGNSVVVGGGGGVPKLLACLICGQSEPRNIFMAHIAEHFNYRPHKCAECDFRSVTAEQMADHEAATEHVGQLYALRNAYLDRMCRFVYNDCDFGEKNGGLEKVLKRKLVSTVEEEHASTGQIIRQAVGTMMKAEECGALASINSKMHSAIVSATVGDQRAGQAVQQWLLQQPQQHQFDAEQQQQQQFYVQSSSNQTRGGDELKLEQLLMGSAGTAGAAQLFQQHTDQNNFLGDDIAAADEHQQPQQENGAKLVPSSSSANACSSMLQQFIAQQPQQQALMPQHFDGVVEQYIHGGQQPTPPPQLANGDDVLLQQPTKRKSNKTCKQVFENVQCLKCRQLVKGRGICLLYHMNTRHLKLPLYRCLACPRDFFYVTDTTAKNHIRSFHGNDLTLLENNYHTYSGLLHGSRREFFGTALRGSEARTQRATRKERAAAAARGAVAATATLKGRASGGMPKQISLRDRPQSGSGPGGSSSHVQCLQCGEFVASIYSSQLTHMNTKHLHMAVYTCRLCGRAFESLSSSAAIMHVKSAHGRGRDEAEAEIAEQRVVCLKELNERYRSFFS
uniref:C2H2-type domain-containing protein n=1 Tax=Globodera pallida TaxID=36090 RepID=A0A183BKU8_GLOPA